MAALKVLGSALLLMFSTWTLVVPYFNAKAICGGISAGGSETTHLIAALDSGACRPAVRIVFRAFETDSLHRGPLRSQEHGSCVYVEHTALWAGGQRGPLCCRL